MTNLTSSTGKLTPNTDRHVSDTTTEGDKFPQVQTRWTRRDLETGQLQVFQQAEKYSLL